MKAKYDRIYLVASDTQIHAKIIVTTKEPNRKPGMIRFLGMAQGSSGPVGTLVLSEEVWQSWFGGREMLPGFETAAGAARILVAKRTNISYGCPLCTLTFSTEEEMRAHVDNHVSSLLKDFTIESDEDPVPTTVFVCPECSAEFKTKKGAQSHIRKHYEVE
jgi:uncharacterized C2H2 Zn-finger protein